MCSPGANEPGPEDHAAAAKSNCQNGLWYRAGQIDVPSNVGL